jgi:CubicO group peptidase (beta-lactamase class C family)
MRRLRRLLALLLCLVGAQARAAAPLPRSTPEAQGIASEAMLDFVAAAEKSIQALHSVMIVRRGHVVAEGWWAPYAAHEPHQLFSLSKSFTSTAVGLAVAEGRLAIHDPVLSFFPDLAPSKPGANLKAMRVRDLLTMSAGHHTEDLRNFPYQGEENVVRKFLELPVAHKPGTLFVYNTPASYMLSAIVQQVTGQSVLDYLQPRLFEPLGIEHPRWEASRQGVSMGGFGLSVRTEDIAKFGQLYLQRGRWGGKQLVPETWVEQATARWMSNGSNPESDWEQGYGFQFWRCRHGIVRGDGARGQFCLIMPELEAVVAITAGTGNLQNVLDVVWASLLPALQAAKARTQPLAADAGAQARLRRRLAELSLPRPVAVGARPALAAKVADGRFVFAANPLKYEAFGLAPVAGREDATEIRWRVGGEEVSAVVSPHTWAKVERANPEEAVAFSGAWTGADTFVLETAFYRTPNTARLELRFAADGEQVMVKTVPGFGPAAPAVTGRRER